MLKKCLVTGGAGFIGSHLSDKLIELGYEVAIVDNLRSGRKENINPQAKFFQIDIVDKEALFNCISEFKPEVIFHLAAQNEVPYSMEYPFMDEQINIVGTMSLLEAATKYSVQKIVYSNTGGAFYGNVSDQDLPIPEDHPASPTSFYGTSKQCAEIYLKLYGNLYNLSWVSLRYSNVYGPRQDGNKEAGIIAIFTEKLLKKEVPTINGNGHHTRDYIFVGDVVEANIKAMDYPENDYFNISTEVETSNNDVSRMLEEELNSDITPIHGPNRPGDPLRNSLSIQKAKQQLGWEPKVDLKTGINLTLNYYLQKAKQQ